MEDMILEEQVALRKESVDRKSLVVSAFPGSVESLSARRAWIENSQIKTVTGCV